MQEQTKGTYHDLCLLLISTLRALLRELTHSVLLPPALFKREVEQCVGTSTKSKGPDLR